LRGVAATCLPQAGFIPPPQHGSIKPPLHHVDLPPKVGLRADRSQPELTFFYHSVPKRVCFGAWRGELLPFVYCKSLTISYLFLFASGYLWHLACYLNRLKALRGLDMVTTIVEERTVYLPSRQRQVRCRLWYEVSPLRDGLSRYFLVGIQELE